MKMRIAIIAACAGTLALTATIAHAGWLPVPGDWNGDGYKAGKRTTSSPALPKNQKQNAGFGTKKSSNIADQAAGGNLSKNKR